MKNLFSFFFTVSSLFFLMTNGFCDEQKKERQEAYYPLPSNIYSEGYNLPGRITLTSSWDFYLKGDFLYWNAKKDTSEYAISTIQALNNPPLKGRALRPRFRWRPGLKIAMGGGLEKNDWTLEAQWTYLLGKAKGSSNAPSGGSLKPLHITSVSRLTNPGASFMLSDWKIYYHTGDLFLGYPYYIGRWLVFSPLFGIRAAWIKDKQKTDLSSISDTNSVTISTLTETYKQRFWYLGPRIGINTNWLLGYGFRLFGNAAGSLLFSRGKIAKRALSLSYATTLGYSGDEVMDVKAQKRNALRPNMNAGFGFGWSSSFEENNWFIALSLSYEFHYWFDYTSGISSLAEDLNTNSGALYLHGSVFTARLDF